MTLVLLGQQVVRVGFQKQLHEHRVHIVLLRSAVALWHARSERSRLLGQRPGDARDT
jgi:hypothetical protein